MKTRPAFLFRRLRPLVAAAFASALVLAAPVRATEVEFQTSMGDFVLKVDEQAAPKTAANFLQYARDGFYNGLIFHRIIPGFVVQGGGFDAQMARRETRPPIENESRNGLKNARHTISMARTNHPHSATSQFFINLKDNEGLDPSDANGNWGYAVFGKVIRGGEVVDLMTNVKTVCLDQANKVVACVEENRPIIRFADVPQEPIVMRSVKILETKEDSQ